MSADFIHPPLATLLRHVEKLSGMRLCLKSFLPSKDRSTRLPALPPGRNLHLSAFCREVKRGHDQRCSQCDVRDIPALACSRPRPFTHRCHAGATEIIIPVQMGDHLAAVVYLGQFREHADQPPELPLLTPARVSELLSLAGLLQSYLPRFIKRSAEDFARPFDRRGHIIQFLQSRLKNDPSLSELARELGVSVSRAGHLVKEVTGETFVELKLRLRLEAARQLLSGTMFTIEHIAATIGFRDVRYFHRVFRKASGLPPGAWRVSHAKDIAPDA